MQTNLFKALGVDRKQDYDRKVSFWPLHSDLPGFEVGSHVDIDRTSFKGYLAADYDDVCHVFGSPTYSNSSDGKVQKEWSILFPRETLPNKELVATIYDWKQYDTEVEHVHEWNIGGKHLEVVDYIKQAFRAFKNGKIRERKKEHLLVDATEYIEIRSSE